MEISNQQVENAIYRYLSDTLNENPALFKQIMGSVVEDQGLLKLMEETDKQDNPSVPLSTIYEYLKS